jgi:hypothetical protein
MTDRVESKRLMTCVIYFMNLESGGAAAQGYTYTYCFKGNAHSKS